MGQSFPADLLTPKQREVLDLLVQHKTSKQIARLLQISPYTVDQRITAARKKFGVETRNELAEVYQRSSGISQGLVYDFPHVGSQADIEDSDLQDTAPGSQQDAVPVSHDRQTESKEVAIYRVVPEIFEGPQGIWVRLAAIGALTIILLVILLGGLAAFGQLSDMLR